MTIDRFYNLWFYMKTLALWMKSFNSISTLFETTFIEFYFFCLFV